MSDLAPIEGDRLLSSLTDEQRVAAFASLAPRRILVEAPAGSGKTRVLAARAVVLARLHGIAPHRIGGLVFSRAAGAELRVRVGQSLGAEAAARLDVLTFHAWALRVLRAVPQEAREQVATEDEAEEVLRGIFHGPQRIDFARRTSVSKVRATASRYAAGIATPDAHEETRVLQLWVERLRRLHLIPYWDLQARAMVVAFLSHPAREALRPWSHLLVDEAQDLTPLERVMVAHAEARQTMLVGDDRQAIFGWRHAEGVDLRPDLQDERDLVTSLTVNHRCARSVLEASNALPVHGTRIPRSPHGARDGRFAEISARPLREVVDDLLTRFQPGEVAVLSRTNREADVAAAVLGDRALRVSREVPATIRVALKIARLVVAPNDPAAFLAVAELDGWDEQQVALLKADAGLERTLLAQARISWTLTPTLQALGDLTPQSPFWQTVQAAALGIRMQTGQECVPPDGHSSRWFALTIESALDAAVDLLREEADGFLRAHEQGKIAVATIHSAKGREWQAVVVLQGERWPPEWATLAARDSTPHEREEVRVLYVATTRALLECVWLTNPTDLPL